MAGSRKRSQRAFRAVKEVVPANDDKMIDATPERLAKEPSEVVDTFRADGDTVLRKARRFRKPHLDRWHGAGMLTQRQWAAGDAYRTTHERCQMRVSVVASYGERINAAANPGDFGYGLPLLNRQAEARREMRELRQQWDRHAQGVMDAFLLHDHFPRYGGKKHKDMVTTIRECLDKMALYLRM